MHCDDETLAAYALGEDGVSDRHVEHVRECTRCRQALDELERTAGFLRRAERPVMMEHPSPQVWARVLAEVTAEAPVDSPAPSPRRDRRRTVISIAAAASVGIGIGFGAGAVLDATGPSSSVPPPPVAATADLRPINGGSPLGEAKLLITGDVTELQVDTPVQQVDTGYLEVWLLNEDGARMISIGILDGDTTQRFPVPAAAVDNGYVIVDISREQFDEDATHSGDSTMRGRLQL